MSISLDAPVELRVHLGDRPNTHALISGQLVDPRIRLSFSEQVSMPAGFRRMVREQAYDISEMPLMTFLQARAQGKSLLLLPAVVLGRFQHGFLACRRDDPLTPQDLPGRTVLARSYSVTTVAWLRAILLEQYGVAPDAMRWLCLEDAHVAEYQAPAFVERLDSQGRSLEALLLEGVADLAMLGSPVSHSGLRPLLGDPTAAARDWYRRTGARQLNHVVTVDASLVQRHPEALQAFWQLLCLARQRAPQASDEVDPLPIGLEAIRRDVEFALDMAFSQGLTPRRLDFSELIDADLVRLLSAEVGHGG